MAKIAFLEGRKVAPRALLHSVAESEKLDAVIVIARRDGGWSTCWSSEIDMGSLCMASMKFDFDVKGHMHGMHDGGPIPDDAS